MARERAWARTYRDNTTMATENMDSTSRATLPRRSPSPSNDAMEHSAPPTFSLTVGNVCFDLVPDATMVENSSFGSILYEACSNSSYALKLDRFTGSLRVRTVSNPTPVADRSSFASNNKVTPKMGENPAAIQSKQKRPWHDDSDDDSSFASNILSPMGGGPDAKESLAHKRSRRFSHSSMAVDDDVVVGGEEEPPSDDDPTMEASFTQQSRFLGQPDLSQTVSHTSTNHGQGLSNDSNESNVIDDNQDDSDECNEESKKQPAETAEEKKMEDESAPGQSNGCMSHVVHDIEKLDEELKPARASIGSPIKAAETPMKPAGTPMQKSEQVSPTSSISPARSTGASSFGGDMMPSARWGHTLTDVGDDKWIVYGGQNIHCPDDEDISVKTLNDFYIYQSTQGKWIRPINFESALPRQWHTSNFLKDQNLLVVFGGECFKNGKSKTNNQVMLLDTEIMVWYPPSVSGSIPSGRSGHTATLLRPSPPPNSSTTNLCSFLIVFGGVGQSGRHQNTIACLDTDRWIWFQPKCEGLPPQPRSYHSTTAISETKMIVFGGNGDEQSFDTVHLLEVTTVDELVHSTETNNTGSNKNKKKKPKKGKNAAAEVPPQYKHHKFTWSSPMTTGPKPAPRTGHSATLMADKKTLCIHGGWDPTADEEDDQANDEETKTFDDTFFLDTEKWTWTKGKSVKSRTGHKAILHRDNKVHVFGGRGSKGQFLGDLTEIPRKDVADADE